jgi:hypothetical protein
MHNLLKRHYADKPGCGCALCKPQKHHHVDRRTRQDVTADINMVQQLQELEEDFASRSLATTPPS